jgi:hypothetical protein
LRMGMTAAEDIVRVLRGEAAINVANRSALDSGSHSRDAKNQQ